ncbi:hypothetical protein JI721_11740 [Alicyclobacillus cycloheptanicus]|uniref:Uncharacterized protein n=1 Tax=Alicyclobacillus cycloheptanicus TaxID=1457 RepID=A0ABT9XHK3_9BACL|nr:hypothetical protein [Alicyclobacillus cycloheptanicus]MDQ0189211.1 hypothetical protein [Alicyclobacillus cycloheptanicus]WDM00396.1 hypothetical protein JI721_11740 [Alicyclobacillus cycloheptanicus]
MKEMHDISRSGDLGRLIAELANLELNRVKRRQTESSSVLDERLRQFLTALTETSAGRETTPAPSAQQPHQQAAAQQQGYQAAQQQGHPAALQKEHPAALQQPAVQKALQVGRTGNPELDELTQQVLADLLADQAPDAASTSDAETAALSLDEELDALTEQVLSAILQEASQDNSDSAHSPSDIGASGIGGSAPFAGQTVTKPAPVDPARWHLYAPKTALPDPWESWCACFDHLSNDPWLLGWVAIRDTELIAADHAYEEQFLRAVQGYVNASRALVNILDANKQVQFTMQSAEGQMWLLPAQGNMWVMLFATNDSGLRDILAHIPVETTVTGHVG